MAEYSYQHGRPSTPTGSARTFRPNGSMRALDTNQPKHETFFDDATPVDRYTDAAKHDPLRDSHDLSFAEGGNVRDSVVDNMLLSLDQFSTGNLFGGSGPQYASYTEDDFFLRDNSYRPPGARHRGHTYTSSRSSDYDLNPDEHSRYTVHHSRARRSNSSNNIGTPIHRKGSTRDMYTGRQGTAQYGQLQQAGHLRSGNKKGSMGSGSSSMDFGQSGVLGNQRLGFGKRSASFDHSNASDRGRISPLRVESVLDRGRVAYQNYPDEYDAAPEPTIPAGPRRMQEPPQSPLALPPQPPFAAAQAPRPGRRGSVRSNTSYRTLRKNKSQPGPSMRAQAQEFVNASTLRELPPVPLWHDPSAPIPAMATRSPLFPVQAPAAPKPGFFRRVFGGGSSKSQTPLSTPSSVPTSSLEASTPIPTKPQTADVNSVYSAARPRTTPNNSSHIATQLKSLPKAPQTATSAHGDAQVLQLPTLGKKPSSFFRRRKKSMSENTRPPVTALDFTQPAKSVLPPQLSPGVSSLRQVMNPYLNDAGRAVDRPADAREEQSGETCADGFSPNYKPHKDATVRAIKPVSRGDDQTPPASRGEKLRAFELSNAGSPKLKLKMKHAKSAAQNQQEDTFLADSSSCNEDYSGRATPTGEYSGAEEARRPSTGPTPSSLRQSQGKSNRQPSGDHRAELLSAPDQPTSRTGSVSQSASEVEDEGWVITESTEKVHLTNDKSPAAKRVWLDTTLPDALVDATDDLELPFEGARSSQHSFEKVSPDANTPISPDDVFHSATSLPIVQVDSRESDTMPAIVEDRSMHGEPTDAERERAFQIYSGDDSSSLKAQAAALLGDVTLSSTRMRKAFMDFFDWTGMTILAAMRDLCGKIILKAETQQVDRILMSLSERWCECNSSHGFKAVDVVHTICYSILLLNTDLHLADIESRMTRSQFVRNTLPTVTRVCQDSVKAAGEETLRPVSTHFRRPSLPWNDKSEPNSPNAEATTFPADVEEPVEARKTRSRLSIRPPARSGSEGLLSFDSAVSDPNTLVNSPYNGPMRGWEIQIETVLKEFYDSIRKQRLPLHGSSEPVVHHQPSSNNLSVSNMLRRTPSVLSKAPSDNTSYRGRSQNDFRNVGSRWASKNRSKQRLYPSSTVASSRTSLDDGSVWSPAGSSSWSRYSYGKTGTSMSVDSLGSHFATGDYQQAIGFANALSQAIIREEGMTIASDEEFSRVAPLLEDETLELVGAPWAKEGILKHKRHLDSVDRKAKDRAWNECFAVVEKGCMRLFSFSMNSKSVRQKSKLRPSAGGVVGGGNWMDNAEALDSFPLRQTIASALPPPGYSKTRPHVFALSLPTGAVHLFQVGTPDICREFVCTVNYWSARLSKEPLMGGVSSMEYGWGENVINPALIRQDSTPSVQGHMPRPSVTSSLRSSMDHATGTPKPRLPGDKVILSDWSPPASSMMASTLMEVDQLRALTDYVKNIENELSHHNELRAPLLIAFSPRHPNAQKAMANWERKSQYLLREIVKFRTYIDTLATAQAQKQKIYAEREAREQQELEEAEKQADTSAQLAEDDGANEASEPAPSKTMPNPAPPAPLLLHP